MLTKIWERYFLCEFIKVFILFLCCFYGLYVLIDYASHTSALPHHQVHIQGRELVRYYVFVFASRADILIPVALLIAFVKTVCTLNTRQELVALLASGMPLKMLMRPFIVVSLICVALLYVNEQVLLPQALKKLRKIEDTHKNQKSRHAPDIAAKHIVLEDGSIFLFQQYDSSKEHFFDAYWIESINSIYRIKFLSPDLSLPMGYFVDHLVRGANGELLQQASYLKYAFPHMRFNADILQSTLSDPDAFSMLELLSQKPSFWSDLNEKESKILTAFYWKLLIPWLCLLAILAPAPFCVRFSRQLPVFLIYVCSLFGLIALYMFMDAAQVVAKRQVLSPLWAICFPFVGLFGFFGWRFVRMK